MPKKTRTKLVNSSAMAVVTAAPAAPAVVKLDLGCGTNKYAAEPGWTGVDVRPFAGVDIVFDLTRPWPWKDASVDEIRSSHFIEHLGPEERIHFVNEAYRILKPGAKATLIAPHWSSCRAYGDLTHRWPPISEFWGFYLSAAWRATNAPHNDGYTCNFNPSWGYSLREDVAARNVEFQQDAMNNHKDVCQDIHLTLVKE
jgi:SAM-dependent methyltransferase